jgi:hypothetical protein
LSLIYEAALLPVSIAPFMYPIEILANSISANGFFLQELKAIGFETKFHEGNGQQAHQKLMILIANWIVHFKLIEKLS